MAKYENRWIMVEVDHTKWQNTWEIVPSTLQYVKKIWNWFPLSGKIDDHWHAHNRISNISDVPLIIAIQFLDGVQECIGDGAIINLYNSMGAVTMNLIKTI